MRGEKKYIVTLKEIRGKWRRTKKKVQENVMSSGKMGRRGEKCYVY